MHLISVYWPGERTESGGQFPLEECSFAKLIGHNKEDTLHIRDSYCNLSIKPSLDPCFNKFNFILTENLNDYPHRNGFSVNKIELNIKRKVISGEPGPLAD